MAKIEITVEIDPDRLSHCEDRHLATLWHVAQANPVPNGDRAAGELAERIGREIIRRWLSATEPELWHHQGRDYYWAELRKLGKWRDGIFVPDAVAQAGQDVADELERR